MADFDETNRGIISKNDRKTEDVHPDIRGEINIEGIEYWLSGWKKARKSDGAPFYSLSVRRKDALRAAAAPTKQRPAVADLMDDDPDSIPF